MDNLTLKILISLINLAATRQKITYADLAAMHGLPTTGLQLSVAISRALLPIAFWCDANRLPPLTAIVVNAETGIPGEGFWCQLPTMCVKTPDNAARKELHDYMLNQVYDFWGSSLDEAVAQARVFPALENDE